MNLAEKAGADGVFTPTEDVIYPGTVVEISAGELGEKYEGKSRRYKAVSEELKAMEEHRQALLPRGNASEELRQVEAGLGIEQDLLHVDLYQLLKYFHQAVARGAHKTRVVHKVSPYPYSIAAQRNYLANRLNQRDFTPFLDLFADFADKMQAIFTFLAMLEMLQVGRLEMTSGDELNGFGLRLSA